MADHKIFVYFDDRTNVGNSSANKNGRATTPLSIQEASRRIVPATTTSADSSKGSLLNGVGGFVLTSSISYATSSVGKWTGSSTLQSEVGMMQSALGFGILAKSNPYIAVATGIMQMITTQIGDAYEIKYQTRESNRMMNKYGLSTSEPNASNYKILGFKH